MGKMMMDLGSYGKLEPTQIVAVSVQESERLCKTWHGAAGGLLEYAVSPRFAVACSEEMMRSAAALAEKHGTYIQTHLSENLSEIETVRQMYPWARDYTDLYHRCGLLTPRTVVGHGVHLGPAEHEDARRRRRQHCPLPHGKSLPPQRHSPLDTVRAAGIRVGLGSDVAAGPELNLWRVMRCALESQKARSFFPARGGDSVPRGGPSPRHAGRRRGARQGRRHRQPGHRQGGRSDRHGLRRAAAYRRSARGVNDRPRKDIVSLCIYRGGPDGGSKRSCADRACIGRRRLSFF